MHIEHYRKKINKVRSLNLTDPCHTVAGLRIFFRLLSCSHDGRRSGQYNKLCTSPERSSQPAYTGVINCARSLPDVIIQVLRGALYYAWVPPSVVRRACESALFFQYQWSEPCSGFKWIQLNLQITARTHWGSLEGWPASHTLQSQGTPLGVWLSGGRIRRSSRIDQVFIVACQNLEGVVRLVRLSAFAYALDLLQSPAIVFFFFCIIW